MNLQKGIRTGALLAIAAVSAAALSGAEPAGCKVSASDESRVVEAVRTMYAALIADDLARWHSIVAPDYYAFDGGKRFDGDALLNSIKAQHAAGKVFVWTVTEPAVHVSCDSAFITYVNRGSIKDASGTKEMGWLESAVLQKVAGSWRISFFHSTRIP